jgi:hypothetical protein
VVVERPDGEGRLVLVGFVDDAPAPERVVGGDQAPLGEAGEHGLVVVDVVLLVGVDENEVELAIEAADRVDRGADVDRDAVGVARLLDVAARDRRVLLFDLARVDAPIRRAPVR